jgi:hypothetical protein
VQATILANLKDPDVSIRRRALDLLFTMCDGGAAVGVVEELVRAGRSCGRGGSAALRTSAGAPRATPCCACRVPANASHNRSRT